MAIKYSEEEHEAMANEFARLFGLPKEADFLNKRHIFEGVVFTNLSPPENLKAVKDWEMRDDDIFVATYPKSGTHWMWEIVFLIMARGRPEKIDRSKMAGSTIEMLFPVEFKVPSHEVFAKRASPRVIITHLPWQLLPEQLTDQKKGKIVYVTRNPKDVLASMSRFAFASSGKEKDERMWKYFVNSFLQGDMPYGSWFDHVEGYWKNRNNDNVFIASYEGMKKDLQSVLAPLSTFILGEVLDDETRKAVEKHSSIKGMKESYDKIEKSRPDGAIVTRAMGKNSFIQKGMIGSWKDFFTVSENELFDKVCEGKMATRGFEIIYA